MIKWIHIRDKQPQHDEKIIQIDPPYEGHYSIGMRKYYQKCTWQELLDYCKHCEIPEPDFWWISAEDFPFPEPYEKPVRLKAYPISQIKTGNCFLIDRQGCLEINYCHVDGEKFKEKWKYWSPLPEFDFVEEE